MSKDIRAALSAMTYREVRPGKWCKPYGYNLFTYEEERAELTLWFTGASDGSIQRMSSTEPEVDIGYQYALLFIKEFEHWAHLVWCSSEFHLAPLMEYNNPLGANNE